MSILSWQNGCFVYLGHGFPHWVSPSKWLFYIIIPGPRVSSLGRFRQNQFLGEVYCGGRDPQVRSSRKKIMHLHPSTVTGISPYIPGTGTPYV